MASKVNHEIILIDLLVSSLRKNGSIVNLLLVSSLRRNCRRLLYPKFQPRKYRNLLGTFRSSCSCVIKTVEPRLHVTKDYLKSSVLKVNSLEEQRSISPWDDEHIPEEIISTRPEPGGRLSDINLVELDKDTVKDDDTAVLLEGGSFQSSTPKLRSSNVASQLLRLFLMDESFLVENRLTLRAIFTAQSMESVKQFLTRYCQNRTREGFVLLQDPLAVYYNALCSGLNKFDSDEPNLPPENPEAHHTQAEDANRIPTNTNEARTPGNTNEGRAPRTDLAIQELIDVEGDGMADMVFRCIQEMDIENRMMKQ